MNYSSPEFVLLLLATLTAYLCAPSRIPRFYILLAASLFFYSRTGLKDTAIFAFVVGVSWLCVAAARRWPKKKRGLITLGIVLMSLHLFFWKYAAWLTGEIQGFWPAFFGGYHLSLPLPIGISFFTLQGIAYLADYAHDDAKFMDLPTYLLFKSFFAQLIAGPIVRARQLLPQLEKLHGPTWDDIAVGISLFTLGLFKKLAMADRIAPFVDKVFDQPQMFTRTVLIRAILAYAVQIWADFSGYTDMGRGAARLFGINLPENFLSPYLARSPSEFWRRWHITLSEWIRDYLYIPLGGGQGNPLRVVSVVVTVMALSGLWHGASWHFVVWGLYHGVLLWVDRGLVIGGGASASSARKIAGGAATFILIAFGWLIFRAPSIGSLGNYCGLLIYGAGELANASGKSVNAIFILAIIIQAIGYFDLASGRYLIWDRIIFSRPGIMIAANPAFGFLAGLALAGAFSGAILLRLDTPANFIYFQF